MQSSDIRRRFLGYFAARGHAVLPSASLVPANDPTVLFTTAGMHPLVPYLLGEPHPLGSRLASVQKCLRTDDIDEVGDNRHCTFFEMLGNWSLGDYFKEEAICWSWEFLTSASEGLGLDPAKLYVTVFAGDSDAARDGESVDRWRRCFKEAGISSEVDVPLDKGGRIFSMAKESNWWPTGGKGVGPCGPDTEIFYDTGRGDLLLSDGMPDFESGSLVEIWNNVFMQFSKDVQGRFHLLTKNNVDTGMGMERMAMVCQGVETIFETDLFAGIIEAIRRNAEPRVAQDARIMRILADHLRASIFLIGDGVRPSNKEQGYILRRLLRRSVLHLQGAGAAWVGDVLEAMVAEYGDQYPELREKTLEIGSVIREEVEKFQKTLAKGQAEIAKRQHLTGKDAFDLYQSYGFPLELSKEYALQRGLTIDEEGFESEFEKHQNLSRTASAGQFKSGLADHSDAVVRYHTATHLLHQALRDVLGPTAQQRGSNLTAERLRFDFSQPEKLTPEQLARIEAIVNAQIAAALPVSVQTMSPAEAKASGAIGLFGDKYGDSITVYSIGDYSKEICTGPHVANTRELGRFRIAKEEAVSAGVRRIKAVLE